MKRNQEKGCQVAEHMKSKESLEFVRTALLHQSNQGNNCSDVQRSDPDEPVVGSEWAHKEAKVYPSQPVGYDENCSGDDY